MEITEEEDFQSCVDLEELPDVDDFEDCLELDDFTGHLGSIEIATEADLADPTMTLWDATRHEDSSGKTFVVAMEDIDRKRAITWRSRSTYAGQWSSV